MTPPLTGGITGITDYMGTFSEQSTFKILKMQYLYHGNTYIFL